MDFTWKRAPTEKHGGVQVGDPLMPVGDGWIIIPGYGDFRLTRETALASILAGEAFRAVAFGQGTAAG